MSTEHVLTTPDFADVYAEQLIPVWRYVRSRVGGYHEAQDLTSEVFTRAWRSWPGFDPGRGAVGAWLFRIAQRTVIDAIRKPDGPPCLLGDEALDRVASRPTPEAMVLRQELLVELRETLSELDDRERDGLALRFAAGLKMQEIGQVLGLSTGATKMMISRSIGKLADSLAHGRRPVAATGTVLLDEVLDDVLERGHPTLSDSDLRELVFNLAVVHHPELPPELPGKVQACVACSGGVTSAAAPADSQTMRWLNRFGMTSFLGLGWLPLAPVCLACTIPALVAPLLATGMSLEMAYGLHALSLATAPMVFFLLWRHYRRHRDGFALWVGGSGAVLLVAHLVVHFLAPGVPAYSVVADQAGTILLVLGALLDLRSTRRWLADQRRRLAAPFTPLVVASAGQR